MSKKKFLCIQRGCLPEGGSTPCEKPSPSQMEEMYAKFNAWMDKYKDNMADPGGGLVGEARVVTSDSVSDGPFAESKEIVGGYMIVEAESIEEAVEVAQQSPGVMSPGSSVEVREIGNP